MKTFETSIDAAGLRFGVAVARFNHLICVRLLEGCTAELARCGAGADAVDVAWVPGAFELPLTVRKLAESGRYDALIALGAVIRGGTPHFDYVCSGVTDGFGVLTTDDIDQALARAGGDEGNKGAEAARVAIEMANLLPRIAKPDRSST